MAEVTGPRRGGGLGVSLLHRLVVEDLLGCDDLPKPSYVHVIEEVVEGLRNRRVSAGRRRWGPPRSGTSAPSAWAANASGQSTYFYAEAPERVGYQSAGVKLEDRQGRWEW